MTPAEREACFSVWAPDDSPWAAWAKPVAFLPSWNASIEQETRGTSETATVPTAITSNANAVLIVDLPGAAAVHMGVALARDGFRPVPLFNGTSGPAAAIDVSPITRALVAVARDIEACRLPADAPPAFLLDSRRNQPETPLMPGVYDNRWVVLPQDFPSGALLASRGIRFATLIRRRGLTVPTDLAHVLRRWQDHGIRTRVIDQDSLEVTDYKDVPKPSFFQIMWYTTIALLGLRRSNVGGFGSRIPEQSGGGGRFA
jgi:hypothetical protein